MTSRQAPPRMVGVDRSLAALRELTLHPRGAQLDDLARTLDQPKSSMHRALAALRRAGLVEQDEHRRYRLTIEFVRLAFAYYEGLDEQAMVQPVLEALADMFGESAHYAVLDGAEVIYVARVAPPQVTFQMAARIGGRQRAHTTALGKMLLAHALVDRHAVERYVDAHGPFAGSATFERELALTRERGYALDDQQNEPGINCIAFPVFLASSTQPAGAISVSAVAQRTPLGELEAKSAEIRKHIEQRIGHVTESELPSRFLPMPSGARNDG